MEQPREMLADMEEFIQKIDWPKKSDIAIAERSIAVRAA